MIFSELFKTEYYNKLKKGTIIAVDDHNAFPNMLNINLGKGNYIKEFMKDINAKFGS